jgi:hypothetical protein
MMSQRTDLANDKGYEVPRDPGCTNVGGAGTVPMVQPRVLDQIATDVVPSTPQGGSVPLSTQVGTAPAPMGPMPIPEKIR